MACRIGLRGSSLWQFPDKVLLPSGCHLLTLLAQFSICTPREIPRREHIIEVPGAKEPCNLSDLAQLLFPAFRGLVGLLRRCAGRL